MQGDYENAEAPDVQGLPQMELAGRLSNPDFLRKIKSLVQRLD